MTEWLIANWQLPAVVVAILVMLVPRLGGVWQWALGLRPDPVETEATIHQLVDAYTLLRDNLADPEATKALHEHVWPAIGA